MDRFDQYAVVVHHRNLRGSVVLLPERWKVASYRSGCGLRELRYVSTLIVSEDRESNAGRSDAGDSRW